MRRLLPWIWTGLVSAGLVVWYLVDPPEEALILTLMFIFAALLFTILGSLIAARQPENRISWLFWAIGLGLITLGISNGLIPDAPPASLSPALYIVIGLNNASWIYTGMFYPLLLLLHVFPTGQFLNRRWSWAGWAGAVMIPATLFVGYFAEDFIIRAVEDVNWSIANPIGFVPNEIVESVLDVWGVSTFAVAVGGIAAMILRYRRSSVVVRTQVKWAVYPLLLMGIVLGGIPSGLVEFLGDLFPIALIGSIALVPVAMTIAITRYKLFEIDRIISRTVAYTVVVGLLALVFAAGVTWIPSALGLDNDPLLVAGSTLAVAALFNPLRKRVQQVVDRRFNRSSYQAQLVSDEFASRLQDSLTVDELAEAWTETVDQHLQPTASGVWLRDD